ncbi:hypothetical protein [Bradyrhizobium sp. Ai1a-2]|uniref:hypothetical protein n=1 Tax=Bradyrhizobium sp. Ai1a-2 TaxID=196490 RepID=UPI00041FB0A4|nr:hypothetical protein [Bradyrhizobium sp. Ai1a-2]
MKRNTPDTFGLPEYFTTDVAAEIDGSNVRIACGDRRWGELHWLFVKIIPADRIPYLIGELQKIAACITDLAKPVH